MTRAPKPVNVNVRLPIDLYEQIDTFAQTEDVTLSEALRQLVVRALENQQAVAQATAANRAAGLDESYDRDGEETFPLPDAPWKRPLAPEDQT